jgi:hypothetical protein
MLEYVIDLRQAQDFEGVVAAFNRDFCERHGGRWQGRNWDASEDYLYSPLGVAGDASSERVRLRFLGFEACHGLDDTQRNKIRVILAGIPQVESAYA